MKIATRGVSFAARCSYLHPTRSGGYKWLLGMQMKLRGRSNFHNAHENYVITIIADQINLKVIQAEKQSKYEEGLIPLLLTHILQSTLNIKKD